MRVNPFDVVRNVRPALAVLFLALLGALAPAVAQTAAAQKPSVDITAEAKRALDKIGTRDFSRVRDAKVREAGTRALNALKKLARNTSKAREAALSNDFDRAVDALKGVAPRPQSEGFQQCDRSYELCMELCKETGGNCQMCAKVNNLCYMTNLVLELVQENDPSKN